MKRVTSKELRAAKLAGENLDDPIVSKAAQAEPQDEGNTLRFTFTTPSVDSDGDRIMSEGVDLTRFQRNPIILLHHDMKSLPIGKCVSLEVSKAGMAGAIEFFTDIDEADIGTNARGVMALFRRGVMGISITFRPKDFVLNTTDGLDIRACELLEVSCVTVPSNPDAYLIPEGESAGPKVSEKSDIGAASRRRALLRML